MRRYPLLFALLAGLLSGCNGIQPEAADGTLVRASITATEAGSRADFDNATYCQIWRTGDRISVFDRFGNTPFELTSGSGTTAGTFRSALNIEESDTYYALYPYNELASLKNGALQTVCPDTLRYDAASGCALGANLMAAVSNGMSFTFYNAATFIQLTMTGSDIIEGITITGNGGEAMAGTATIAFENNRVASVTLNPDGPKSIYVDCRDGIALSATPKTVIIPVPPVLQNGFTLDFSTRSERIASKRSSNPTEINTLLQMPAFTYSGLSYANLTAGPTFNVAIKNLSTESSNAEKGTSNTAIIHLNFVTGADLSQIAGGVDVSAAGDGSILATFKSGTLTVSTSHDRIKTGTDASYLFSQLRAMTDITGAEKLVTSAAVNMRNMFHYCLGLKTLDVSWLDVENVTNLTSFINHCENLTAIDLSAWNPTSVTTLSYLFNSCYDLESITLGERFRQVNPTGWYCAFYKCNSLTSLDEENLNFSAATNLNRCFCECYSLTELDFGTAGPVALTKADSAFNACSNLERLNLSSFNTKNATHLRHFLNLSDALSDVTLGENFQLASVTNRANFFPALSDAIPEAPSTWKTSLATAQTLISVYDNAAEALRAGKLVLQNPSGNAYVYKNAQGTVVSPTSLATAADVKALTVCEP